MLVVGPVPAGTTFVVQGNGQITTFDATGHQISTGAGPSGTYLETQTGGAIVSYEDSQQVTHQLTQQVTYSCSASTINFGGISLTNYDVNQNTNTNDNSNTNTNTQVINVFNAATPTTTPATAASGSQSAAAPPSPLAASAPLTG